MALILSGFACAGKTTLGKRVAQKLSIPFFDTDHLIEAQTGFEKKVSQIWVEEGEYRFRTRETEGIHTLKKEPSVIALGGGALLSKKNCAYLKHIGQIIYLKGSLTLLYERLIKRGLPAYLNKERPYAHLEEIALDRFPLYEATCDAIIEIDRLSEEEIITTIENYGWK